MDELYNIRAFIEAVENGSFSAAARREDVSVSSIARRIAALENQLGVRLVNRNTRKLSVTEAGNLFYKRTRKFVRDLEAAKAEATSFQETVKGVLRVSMRISVGVFILPKLRSFLDQHPGLTIALALTDERQDLVAENIDVGVWVGRLDDSELIAKLLSPGKRVLCGSEDYFARRGVPAHPNDLENHDCLAFRAPEYDGTWRFSKGGQRWDIVARGPFQSSSGLALMEAAVSGLGLVVLQEFTVSAALRAGHLRPVLTDFRVSPTEADTAVYAIYPHSRHLSPKARAFIDFLVASFRGSASDQAGVSS
jgi:DNA-binding transcriptional LysR family regulator